MLSTAAFGRALVVSAVTLIVTPSFAASSATEVYLANIRLNVDFIAASSELADTNAKSDALKRYADGALRHQGDVMAKLDDWRAREGTTQSEVASLPLETGRSVADSTIDVNKFAPPPGIGVLMPASKMTLDQMAGLNGQAFDASYTSTQLGALERLEAFYDAYSRTGDDDSLREMAASELGTVRAEIAEIGKV